MNQVQFVGAESFSKAFYKMYGIYPSYYLDRLNKIQEEERKGKESAL